jgi:predicted DNA-binding antitoxin AbrB/MazE fold protein
MTIAAKYEDGVFKPLEEVKLTEGTRVEVHVAGQPRRRPKSVREFAAFGMWATARTSPTASRT